MKTKTGKHIHFTSRLITEIIIVCLVVTTLVVVGITHYNKEQSLATEKTEEILTQQRLKDITLDKTDTSIATSTPQEPTTQPSPSPAPSSSTNSRSSAPSPTPSIQQQQSSQNPSSSGTPTPTTPPVSTSPTSDMDTPQVALTFPSVWGQIVSGVITINATAADNTSGINRVVLMVRKIGVATPIYSATDTSAPYSTTFDTRTLPNSGSDYTVEAQAFDNVGWGNLASLRITIQN